MRTISFWALMLATGTCRAEVTCFRTPGQAAVQVGEQDGGGFQLEFVRRDALTGRSWARVRSCAHPEWPAVLVAAEGAVASPVSARVDTPARTVAEQVLVKGGQRVTLLDVQGFSRIEASGIALSSGRFGSLVGVRLLTSAEGEERVVQAVVRGADLVEMAR